MADLPDKIVTKQELERLIKQWHPKLVVYSGLAKGDEPVGAYLFGQRYLLKPANTYLQEYVKLGL